MARRAAPALPAFSWPLPAACNLLTDGTAVVYQNQRPAVVTASGDTVIVAVVAAQASS
jgi:hypothetical protein